MGVKIAKYFDLVSQKDGLVARMRLAMKTGVSSQNAMTEQDSSETLAKFYEAAKEILGASCPRL